MKPANLVVAFAFFMASVGSTLANETATDSGMEQGACAALVDSTVRVDSFVIPDGDVRVLEQDTAIIADTVKIYGTLLGAPAVTNQEPGGSICIQANSLTVTGIMCAGPGFDAVPRMVGLDGGSVEGESGTPGGNLVIDVPSIGLNLESSALLCSGSGGDGQDVTLFDASLNPEGFCPSGSLNPFDAVGGSGGDAGHLVSLQTGLGDLARAGAVLALGSGGDGGNADVLFGNFAGGNATGGPGGASGAPDYEGGEFLKSGAGGRGGDATSVPCPLGPQSEKIKELPTLGIDQCRDCYKLDGVPCASGVFSADCKRFIQDLNKEGVGPFCIDGAQTVGCTDWDAVIYWIQSIPCNSLETVTGKPVDRCYELGDVCSYNTKAPILCSEPGECDTEAIDPTCGTLPGGCEGTVQECMCPEAVSNCERLVEQILGTLVDLVCGYDCLPVKPYCTQPGDDLVNCLVDTVLDTCYDPILHDAHGQPVSPCHVVDGTMKGPIRGSEGGDYEAAGGGPKSSPDEESGADGGYKYVSTGGQGASVGPGGARANIGIDVCEQIPAEPGKYPEREALEGSSAGAQGGAGGAAYVRGGTGGDAQARGGNGGDGGKGGDGGDGLLYDCAIPDTIDGADGAFGSPGKNGGEAYATGGDGGAANLIGGDGGQASAEGSMGGDGGDGGDGGGWEVHWTCTSPLCQSRRVINPPQDGQLGCGGFEGLGGVGHFQGGGSGEGLLKGVPGSPVTQATTGSGPSGAPGAPGNYGRPNDCGNALLEALLGATILGKQV